MRILIVNTNEKTGGAAVAARRLTEALNNNGVKARMLVMEKQTDALFVVARHQWLRSQCCFLWERMVIWACNLFSRRNLFKVSIANTGTDITRLREFQEADIIHLHWINQGFLSLAALRKILDAGKPVVWTMHDMWPITAICHHAYECNRYQTACHHCPFLRLPANNDLSARVFRRKQQLLSGHRVQFVAVSHWLAQRATASALTGSQPLEVIANSIPLARFAMINRIDARSTLHVTARYVVCFGAARIDDDIKGLPYLLQALQLLVDRGVATRDELHLLLFGGIKNEGVLQQVPVAYTYLGYINDPHQMSLVYSASDCVVSSSLYETFGQTLIEAAACGCTPVAFAGSGQADIISHRQNGFLADYLSADSLADGIAWALKANLNPAVLRTHVLSHYGESIIAQKYIKLYERLLA